MEPIKRKRLTTDIINERIAERGYALVGEYTGNKFIKHTFRHISCGHEWEAQPANIMNGKNCPKCSVKNEKLTANEVKSRIPDGYVMLGDYQAALKKTLFTHLLCGNKWMARPSHIMDGKGCPKCSTHGFDQTKPGSVYIIDFGDFIKCGITNDLSRRLYEHRKHNGNFILKYANTYNDGVKAVEWERNIKTKFNGRFVTKERCPDGYTETFHPSILEYIIEE